jgi:hypothetical protein
MKSFTSLFSALVLAAALPLHATLLVEETFNYTVGSNIGGVAATGTGLTGNWQRRYQDTATAILRVDNITFATPTGYGFTPAGRGIVTPNNTDNSAAVNLASGSQINFGVNGTFYYSFLLNYTDGTSNMLFGLGNNSSDVSLIRVQGLNSGALRVAVGSSAADGAVLANGSYLVVGRITTNATGNDGHRLWVYGSGDSIALADPGTAGSYAAQATEISGIASMAEFRNMQNAAIGDFRMGTTWEAVVIPEPGTYVVSLLALVGAAVAFRRFRK